MSANTIRKAKKLVESGGIEKIEDDLYQIKSSSDPNKSYFVTSDSVITSYSIHYTKLYEI